jgi:predicted dehydrogenase
VLVQVGHIEHFNPVMGFLEKEVSQPKFISAERLAPFTPRGTEVGVVLDLMIHDIGIVLELVKSPVVKIDSVGVSVLSKTEDIANARLQFANGCVANLSTSRMSLKKVREIRVFQPSGYFSFDFMNQTGHLVRKTGMMEYAGKLIAGAIKPGDLSAVPIEPVPLEKGEPLALELAHFVDSVAKAKQPKVGAALGKTALEVAIAVTEQIRAAGTKG